MLEHTSSNRVVQKCPISHKAVIGVQLLVLFFQKEGNYHSIVVFLARIMFPL